jgi:DNA-binding NarL/FixJ family response regulator
MSGARLFARMRMAADLGACAEAARHAADKNRNPESLGTLAYVLGECALAEEKPDDAVRQFLLSKSEFEKLGARFDAAGAAARAGAAYLAMRSPSSGVPLLRESYRTAKALGARPLLDEVLRELEAAGATPGDERAPATKGGGARQTSPPQAGLTRRQMEVAKLVAEGLTNKEVAGRLHLSPRTVDMHVAALLDRLDCRTRSQAVRKLVDLGLVD